ncbi:MAG: transcription-repair coupling factor [Dehalococcoidia bacterium]|nr:transcription-repair coupling factor [Dehalococcoidia bacterium]
MNLNKLVTSLMQINDFNELGNQSNKYTLGIAENAKIISYSILQHKLKKNLAIITSNEDKAKEVFEILQYYSLNKIIYLPAHNHLPFEHKQWSKKIEMERINSLSLISKQENARHSIVMSINGAMQKTISPNLLNNYTIDIHLNDVMEIFEMAKNLVSIGYESTNIVSQRGEFVKRGGVVDIFPINTLNPIRIEFENNIIISIRSFFSESQRTIEKIDSVSILPRKEWFLDEKKIFNKQKNIKRFFKDYPEIIGPSTSTHTALDFIEKDNLLVIDEPKDIETFIHEQQNFINERKNSSDDIKFLKIDPASPSISHKEYKSKIVSFKKHIYIERWAIDGKNKIRLPFYEQEIFFKNLNQFVEKIISKFFANETTIIISQQAQRITELLNELGQNITVNKDILTQLKTKKIQVIQGNLPNGYIFETKLKKINVITDKEIFGYKQEKRITSKSIPKILDSIIEGNFVVHQDYGIARFLGLVKKNISNKNEEYLELQFADNDKIYLPIIQINKLTKYIASSNNIPKLSTLNSNRWLNARNKAAESIDILAAELFEIYLARKKNKGHAFSKDNEWQKQLEDSFQYQETEDQNQAIRDVKRDMESVSPMDRLICGDVGFGKTEVALRAAFKAIQDGFQVAILVPTTVLAEQHLRTFQQRLAAFPINIASLSRFKKPKEAKLIIEQLKQNKIDILIGTHKILSSNIQFSNLGLVIIDEEQKFGVIHKEKLKKFKLEVDTLTMSATPIPRTMYMGIGGLKDLSMIESVPEGRMSIRTFVSEYSQHLIIQAIENEINRNGQVYFVHNKVMTINNIESELKMLMPEIKINIAHGQMQENDLERVMNDFHNKKFDILLCTTIIESGIDNPNVNTIIVDESDKLGLSQLYQLRGRIGRGTNQGYAYLFYKKNRKLNDEAKKRLSTIFDASNLGSGFQVALKDLEIRGAGNLLGDAQSGHISAIGLELYTQMLSEAITNKKSNMPLMKQALNYEFFAKIDFDYDLKIFIPDSYMQKNEMKLDFYRKLSRCKQETEIYNLEEEIEDRFGKSPKEISNIFHIQAINLAAKHANIESISIKQNTLTLLSQKELPWNKIEKKFAKQILNKGTKKIELAFNYNKEEKLIKIKEIITELST